MKAFTIKLIMLCTIICFVLMSGCKKFLDEKPDAKLVVPTTLKDLQALLDDYTRVNGEPSCMEISSDDYYLTPADFNSLPVESHKSLYTWKPYNVFLQYPNEWGNTYKVVYYANTVLEQVEKIPQTDYSKSDWQNIKGQALYHRAKSFLVLVSAWSLAFDSVTAATDLGIPLRLSTDFNESIPRSSVAQTYNRIINDLKQAALLLPVSPVHVMRPSRPAAYGLLARTFLYMRQYALAGKYADSSLQLKNQLMDFNSLNPNATLPITPFNVEVLIENKFSATPINNSRAKIDSLLYISYLSNDLRKTIFFKSNNNGTYGFKGSYAGTSLLSGIAVDEMLLIRAESHARLGNLNNALADLNALLVKRFKTGTFIPYTASTSLQAIDLILAERRKELLMRSIRWMDIKRLNKEGYNITGRRILNTQILTLPPNDSRYAIAIPEDVITISGILQNPR